MKLAELLDRNLVFKEDDNKYRCGICGKKYSKTGVPNHYFYNHEEEGIKKKEHLRSISLENNNKPEMKKKISEGIKKAYEENDSRRKMKEFWSRPEIKQWCSERNKKLWKDPNYRKKTTEGIRASRTEEFCNKLSDRLKEVMNDPNSKVKSEEFSQLQSEIVKDHWQDPEQYEYRCKRLLESWKDPDRRKKQSEMAKNMWEDSDHIHKVLEGKLRNAEKNGLKCYGEIGETKGGTIYESRIEKEIFEFLEDNSIDFSPHQQIPESRLISDLVINNNWIEIDGLGRDNTDQPHYEMFQEKLSKYEDLKSRGIIKDFKVFTSFEQFLNWLNGGI